MALAVPSRFACLKIEDDDYVEPKKVDKKKIDRPNPKKPEKPSVSITIVKKQPQKQTNKKDKKNKVLSEKQWQEWKEKDDEFVDGHFETDLQNALILSKLDYEQNKDVYDKLEKESEDGRKGDKKKKNKTMSLDQFLGANGSAVNGDAPKSKPKGNEKFFEQIQQGTKQMIINEKIKDMQKVRERDIESVITSAQFHDKLRKEREKNAELTKELEKLRKEIADVKSRNKKLCSILGYGEMRDKADVLMELERLNNMKTELTDEVSTLHVLLEQERSKVAALTADSQKHKDKKHKKHA